MYIKRALDWHEESMISRQREHEIYIKKACNQQKEIMWSKCRDHWV